MPTNFDILVDRSFAKHQLISTWHPTARDGGAASNATTLSYVAQNEAFSSTMSPHRQDECRLLDWELQASDLLLAFGPARIQDRAAAVDSANDNQGGAGSVMLTDGAGVCSVVRSHDQLLVVQKRSGSHIRYPGWYHVCGGILESQRIAERTVVDPFAWMQVELHEELSIKPGFIQHMTCLGLVKDRQNQRPELVFETWLGVKTERFARQQGPEHSELLLIPDAAIDLRKFIVDREPRLVPSGLASLLLYGKTRYGHSWFDETLSML